MALTKTQVSQLYVTLLGRASEANGNAWWQKGDYTMASAAKAILDTATAKAFFGSSLDDNMAFINHIYQNVLGRTYQDDPAGVNFWVNALKTYSRGDVVSELIKSAEKNNEVAFTNKVKISDYVVDQGDNVDAKDRSLYVNAVDKAAKEGYDAAKAYVDSLSDDNQWVSTPKAAGETKTLTTSTDEAVANVFEAPMGYNPGGTDYINTLQDEDRLVGVVGRSDNTVNATFGRSHGDESTGASRTPNLVNIQYFNAKITGDTGNTIDLRYANELTKVNLHHIANQANNNSNIKVTNISSKLEGMRVANFDDSDRSVEFEYKQGILSGNDDKSLLELNDVIAKNIKITNKQNDKEVEGIEKLTLVAKNGVDINELQANDLQELTVKGSGNLEIANLEKGADNEYNKLSDTESGINPNGTNGFTNFDASAFKGKVTVDISKLVTDWVDPNDSANFLTTTITGSAQDDVFYTSTMGGRTKIVGGNGNDKLVLVDGGIGKNSRNELAEISGIESLEVRNQRGESQAVDFDAIKDNVLEKVVVRDEKKDAVNPEFIFTNVSKDFADNKKFVIEHSVTKTAAAAKAPILDISLKDATGANDKVTVEVVKANNKQEDFGYTVKANAIEHVNLIDSDDDNNIVTLIQTGAKNKDADIVVTGGVAGKFYELQGDASAPIKAAKIDASEYNGDFRVTVARPNAEGSQEVALGKGNDMVTFGGGTPDGAATPNGIIGNLTSEDKISDNGGDDTLRAIFDADTTLNVTGTIENLHIAANKSLKLDISKTGAKNVVFMSKQAVAQEDRVLNNTANGMYTTADGIKTTSIVTMDESNLSALNFWGDLTTDDKKASETVNSKLDHDFNGVTLKNNASENLDVNVSASLDTVSDKAGLGAKKYNIGQITAHGSKNINVNVSDELVKTNVPADVAQTTINNIAGRDINTVTVKAKGHVNLNTVSADLQHKGISKVDAEGVKGDFKASVIALGDGATVTLGDGNNVFSALGSAGKLINITAGKGNNKITGSAQSDFITAGNGANVIDGDRGDNVIKVGSGNDYIVAKDGNDTVSLGEGFDSYKDNFGTTIDARNATTTVSKEGGVANVQISVNGTKTLTPVQDTTDTAITAQTGDVNQMIAVGKGSELNLQWLGGKMVDSSVLLDGGYARNFDVTTQKFTALGASFNDTEGNNDLIIGNNGAATTINGGDGNDVFLSVFGGKKVTFNGGAGNDAAVGSDEGDEFTGGTGADIFVTNRQGAVDGKGNMTVVDDGATDKIFIRDGDSVAGSHDTIYGFAATAANNDELHLASKKVAADQAAADTGVESLGTLTVTNGVATFSKGITAKNLDDALSYLASKYNGTLETVAFAYDKDGSDATANDKSTFVFQDGVMDTVVELAGTTGVTAVSDAAAANTITLA